MAGDGLCVHMAGFLGVITRLRNPLLASLRDSPKPRPDSHWVIPGSGQDIGKIPFASVEGP